MKIAVFHYFVTKNNPAGKCVRAMVAGLAADNDITVFACKFDNPDPKRVRWVRIPSVSRPLFLLYFIFFIFAPFYYFRERFRVKFDRIIFTESRVPLDGIAYAHYCHRAYLKSKWKDSGTKGLLRLLRYWNHSFHSLGEKLLYPRVCKIVVPSWGLRNEILSEYRAKNVVVIPNPVENDQMVRPTDFDIGAFRAMHNLSTRDLLMVFVALGDFERKGLKIVFDAIVKANDPRLKLIVVGGNKGAISSFCNLAKDKGIATKVIFVGMQTDIRPYLWASDVFVFPTLYEIFPLVVLEAAAAGLILLVTRVYGVEEYIKDGENGFIIERNVDSTAASIATVLALDDDERSRIGTQAQRDVQQYSMDSFVSNWRVLLQQE